MARPPSKLMTKASNNALNVVWTCFDITPDIVANIQGVTTGDTPTATYCVYQHELAPGTGKEHLQGYTEFTKPMTWVGVKTLFGSKTIHCEARRGKAEQAAAYCKKDETRKPGSLIFESGQLKGKGEGQGKRSDLADIAEQLMAGTGMKTIAETYPATYMRNHKGIHAWKAIVEEKRNHMTTCMVIYGASDSGKSTWVRKCVPDACWITKGVTGCWFDNYNGEKVIVFEEFSGWMPFTWFKRLVDQTPLSLDAKGSSRNMIPQMVIFLSNNPPEEWWGPEVVTGENIKAFKRRLHLVFHAKELMMAGDKPTGLYTVRCKNAFLPFNACYGEGFTLGKLTHEQSLEVMAEACSDERREELKILSGMGYGLWGSGGVILTPPLFIDPKKNITEAMDWYIRTIFGLNTPVSDESAAPPASPPPVMSPDFGAQNLGHEAELGKIGVDFPWPGEDIDDLLGNADEDMSHAQDSHLDDSNPYAHGFKIGGKRKETPLRRSKARRKNPYIDDEADEE